MNDKGNRYALSALTRRRGELTTEIAQIERRLRHRKELKVHIDATLKLLNPNVDLDKIKSRRRPDKRVKRFRAGELGRLILDTTDEEDIVTVKAETRRFGGRLAVGLTGSTHALQEAASQH